MFVGYAGFLARCSKPSSCWVGAEGSECLTTRFLFFSLLGRKGCPSVWNTSPRLIPGRLLSGSPPSFCPHFLAWIMPSVNHLVSNCHQILLSLSRLAYFCLEVILRVLMVSFCFSLRWDQAICSGCPEVPGLKLSSCLSLRS